jgi:serine/threonine protein kinase/Flp pilus assembly protein TadD
MIHHADAQDEHQLNVTVGDCRSSVVTSDELPPDNGGGATGRFTLLHCLGQGSAASVYKAWDALLNQYVALKIFHPGCDADVSIMRREVRCARRLNHPGFVRIHDIVEHAGTACISMEFVEGQTLRNLLRTDRLPVKAVIEIGIQVSEALSYAHSRQIVHCDLKPENILIANGRALLTDFGLSISLQSRVDSGDTRGTAIYMSPEQRQCLPVDHRTDIYSLGLILAEAALGRQLKPDELVRDHHQQREDALRGIRCRPLRALLLHCLQFDLKDRLGKADLLARNLKTILHNDSFVPHLGLIRPSKGHLVMLLLFLLVFGGCAVGALMNYSPHTWTTQTIAISPVATTHGHASDAHLLYDALWGRISGNKQVQVWLPPPGTQSAVTVPSYRTVDKIISIELLDLTHCKIVITRRRFRILRTSMSITATASTPSELPAKVVEVLGNLGVPIDQDESAVEDAKLGALEWHVLSDVNEVVRWSVPDSKNLMRAVGQLDELAKKKADCALCYLRRAQANLELYFLSHDPTYATRVRADAALSVAISTSNDVCLQVSYLYVDMNDGEAATALLRHYASGLLNTQKGLAVEGLIFAHHGLSSYAASTLAQSVAQNPLDTKAANQLALTHLELQQYAEAIRVFEKILIVDPSNRAALNNMALSFLRADNVEKAKPLFERIVEIAPSPEAFANLGVTLIYSGQPSVALPYFEEAAKLAPRSEEAIGYLGHAYRWCGRQAEARAAYQQAIKLASDDVGGTPKRNVFSHLAIYSAALGKADDVERYLGLARRQNNASYFDLDSADAWSRILLGDRSTASQIIARMVHTGSSMSDLRRHPDFKTYIALVSAK